MAVRSTAPLPAEAEQLKQQIQDWRRAKANPSVPMPGALWGAAIRLAKGFGVCRISRAVGLDYGWLRKRVSESSGPVAPDTDPVRRTATDPGPPVRSSAAGPEGSGFQRPVGCRVVVELSAPDGARMRVRLEAGTPLDLAGLVSSFLGRGR